jgi:hypothetical protein
MCQTGTCGRLKHTTKDYITILINETLKIWWADNIGYHHSFVKNHARNILETEGSDFTDHYRINGLVICFLNKTQLIVCL